MGTKIVELPQAPNLTKQDLLPISKNVNNVRNTYKTSVDQLGNLINQDVYDVIDQFKNDNKNNVNLDYLNSHFVHLSGDTMQGNLSLSSYKIQQFSGDIKTITADTFLNQNEHNGCILLVEKGPLVTPDDRVLLKINVDTLKVGFNALIIQTGDIQVKVSNPDGKVDLLNSDNSLSTRKKYSQMNLVVIKNQTGVKDSVWLSGDIV